MNNNLHKHNRSSVKDGNKPQKPTTTFRQAVIIILVAVGFFFGLLEGGLALLGVQPVIQTEDPFVGFASNVPLFVPSQGPDGQLSMVTADNQATRFNRQTFPQDKPSGSYRIFCLGGSTTYGRPYNDATSFARWLREILPAVDSSVNWEVINAGGISYASYRVAHLMEELVNYQPDLFIIYTGHNEFLEERTYRKLREIPPLVQSTVSLLAHTRTWAAMDSMLQSVGLATQSQQTDRDTLAADVDSKLSRSIGPESYTRNDPLQEKILEHYRLSLERMVRLARSAGAQVIFVTPAANLKDSSPFKSEHTGDLAAAARQQTEELLTQAQSAIHKQQWSTALGLLNKAVEIDPRNAELQYRRGNALLALDRYQEAETAFLRARDEDVCPLRALTPMRGIMTRVARESGVALVDYIGLLEARMQHEFGQPVPGKEFFLDHVHPTIEGHKLLALALTRSMTEQGLVHPIDDWENQAIPKVAAKIESGIDQEAHGQALANLARVLFWAGKNEDAFRLANQAMEIAGDYPQVAMNATSTLVTNYQRQGYLERALRQLTSALERAPSTSGLHLKIGKLLGKRPYMQLDVAAAHLLWACQQMPGSDSAYQLFGQTMAWRGRPTIAYASLLEALRINPNNEDARAILAKVKPMLGEQPPTSQIRKTSVELYANESPRKLVQLGHDDNGRTVPDGITVEFHENGRVKHLVDFDRGLKSGIEMAWDEGGQVLARVFTRQDKTVDLARARRQLYAALAKEPGSVKLRLQLGNALMNLPFLQMDEAAAHLLLACQQQPDSDVAFQLFGQAMARRGRLEVAYASLMNALRLNPGNQSARRTLAEIDPLLKNRSQISEPPRFQLESEPSPVPRKIVQMRQLTEGRSVADGITVEYYQNGRVKRLVDFDKGVQDGLEMTWDENGRLLSCVVFLQGSPAYDRLGS